MIAVVFALGAVDASADDVLAPAKDGSPPPPASVVAPPERTDNLVSYSHNGQIQASLRLALGMRAIVAYDDADYCGEADASTTSGNAPVCSGRVPFSMDFELGYGIARRIDLLFEMRVGLESDFNSTSFAMNDGPRMFHVSPGARFFFSDAKTSKLFTTAQIVFDLAGYEDGAGVERGSDFGVRNLNGLWFDLDRAYGFYAYVGETATFARWMRFELEAGVGISGRYR